MDDGTLLLARFRGSFAREALHIVLPLEAEALAGLALPPFARGGVLVGDGGGEFFSRFLASGAASESHPLDAFTRRRVSRVVSEVVAGDARIFFPFATERVHLPFQQLGVAAGLPPPGPLGVQVHPVFGPWWAYRAFVALPVPLAREAPSTDSCAQCAGPCVNECATHAAAERRWRDGARVGAVVCNDDCGARSRCPVGRACAYPAEQIAFHARARRASVEP